MVTNQEGMRMIGAYPADEKCSIFKLVYLTPDAQLFEILYQPSDGTFGEWKPITPPAIIGAEKMPSLAPPAVRKGREKAKTLPGRL